MSFSLARSGVFLLIGLPIGFILTALGFVVTGREISAPLIAPYALGMALVIALGAAVWKTGE
ncbi:MAG: hypothetical protein O3C52_02810 [Proteobacteria bacterium]|nr:hypothetical protein [Pseudomonadota bacterium]MDA0913835.1 hypothetical protein [Pseudomonadota bacterium]MDA1032294.1 hypothetical protein [Pseudomonadota bacterium]